MTTTPTPTRFDVRPVTTVIGAEVHGIDLRQPLDAASVEELSAALAEWKVLFFRDQALTRDQHVAFGRAFGALTPGHPIHAAPDDRDEVLVVDTREAKVSLGYGERDPFGPPRRTINGWHTDITFVANPAAASILRGVVIPPHGGDTLWTNLVAAYEDLSVPVRNFVDGLQAVHVWHGYDGITRDGHDASKPPSAIHPIVRVHPVTGEKALFVNPVFTRYVVGLSDRESSAILGVLFDQLERPQFQVRFRWEPDSIAFWDNRATAHLGPVDLASADFDRRVERVTVVGDIPRGPDGFRSLPLEGQLFE
jgi:alpha-ketoglutarate-dependent sulfate ester dioxygenase